MGIIEYINPEEWQQKEIYWIKEMKSHIDEGGYNLTRGGDGSLGRICSGKTRSKIRNSRINTTSEIKLNASIKIREARYNNIAPMLNKHHSNETKEKIRQKHIGKKLSKEHIEKIRITSIGRKFSLESRIKKSKSLKGKNTWSKGLKHSKKSIDNMKKGILEKRIKIQCPHCKKLFDPGNYRQWHGDNCKFIKEQEVVQEFQMSKNH